MAQRSFEVFHIVLTKVGHAQSDLAGVLKTWKPLLGQRLIQCDDHEKIAEVIVSAIEVNEGANADTVAASWGGSTAVTVANAVTALAKARNADGTGLLRFFRGR